MRVLLISPHWLYVYEQYGDLAKAVNFHPPLGLCALAAAADARGHETKVLDAEGQELSLDTIAAIAADWRPDLVGITLTTPVIEAGSKIAQVIKARLPAVRVLVGGPHVTLTGAETLASYDAFDMALAGEGEVAFPDLLDRLQNHQSPLDLPGMHMRVNGRIESGVGNSPPLDLDKIPFPDRTKLDLNRYKWSVPRAGLRIMASIQASRGCPLKCIFCSERNMYPKAVRWKSVDRVLEELAQIRATTPAEHIVFLDDTITLDRRWALRLFNGMAGANFGFTWEGETTANRVDDEIVAAMVKSGLRRINFGIESGDPEMLARLGKGVKLEEIRSAYKLMKKFGVETRGSVMLGNPYETRKTVRRTLFFIWQLNNLDQAYINIAAPYPGTVLREMALNGEGGVTLLDKSYSALRRYGGGVMRVNDLTPRYLSWAQRVGTVLFYAHPRRLYYNLKRSGFNAMLRNVRAFLRSFRRLDGPVQVMSGI